MVRRAWRTDSNRVRRALRVARQLLVLAPLASCLPTAADRYGELRVQVLDDHGEPVANTQVQPYGGWSWSERRAVEFTGPGGDIRFRLPQTTYHVHAFPPPGYRHSDPAFPVTYAVVEVGASPVAVILTFVRD